MSSVTLANNETSTKTLYHVLFAISFVHLLNDTIQAVIPAIFPILKDSMALTFFQVGAIAFALNFTASVMQPLIGLYTDSRPAPVMLPLGMVSTFLGVLGLSLAPSYPLILISVVLIGVGSAVFHPEGSRVVHMAAGRRKGLAQSIFQVGGNSGQSLAPVLTALIFVRLGQFGAIWFTAVAAAAVAMQVYMAKWYRERLQVFPVRKRAKSTASSTKGSRIAVALILLVVFVFARTWYHSAITNYYAFYLMDKYHVSLDHAQVFIFLFLAAGAAGTFCGGPLADRYGKRNILLFSMLGSAPFALLLPHVGIVWAYLICLVNGFIILSSFSVMVIYAQDLLPGKVGMASGLTVGLAFGMGAIGSAALGGLADSLGIAAIMNYASFLPIAGLIAFFLPSDRKLKEWSEEA